MAWEISMSEEGWQEVYETLHEAMEKETLADAIATERMYAKVDALAEDDEVDWDAMEAFQKGEARQLRLYTQDALADEAYRLIEHTNTSETGGGAVWIDRKGDHKVNPDTLYEHRFGQAVRLLDMEMTGHDPATVEAYYRRAGLINSVEFAKGAVVLTLSDEHSQVGFHSRSGEMLPHKDAKRAVKHALENAGMARELLRQQVITNLRRKDPHVRFDQEHTHDHSPSLG